METTAPSHPNPDRYQRGEVHHNAKLREEQVLEIRARYNARSFTNRVSTRSLAAEYDVSPGTIYAIVSGRNWRHL